MFERQEDARIGDVALLWSATIARLSRPRAAPISARGIGLGDYVWAVGRRSGPRIWALQRPAKRETESQSGSSDCDREQQQE
jgi:hypothetical protein